MFRNAIIKFINHVGAFEGLLAHTQQVDFCRRSGGQNRNHLSLPEFDIPTIPLDRKGGTCRRDQNHCGRCSSH